MRFWLAILAYGATTAGACASSFVTVAPPAKGQASSFVVLGDWQPEAQAAKAREASRMQNSIARFGAPESALPRVLLPVPPPSGGDAATAAVEIVSPSIIAFDMAAPNVTFEKVAAIAPQPPVARSAHDAPVVIRGGIVGTGSANAEPVALPTPAKTASKAGKAETRTNAAGQKVVVTREDADARRQDPAAPAGPVPPMAATPPRERSTLQ